MSLIEDANRLAEALGYDGIVDEHGSGGETWTVCRFCDAVVVDPKWAPHKEGCPNLALPRIVAVIEAAERLLTTENAQPWGLETPMATGVFGAGPACYWCAGDHTFGHASDCPWQALVAALKGESPITPVNAP